MGSPNPPAVRLDFAVPAGWGQRTAVMGVLNLTPDSFSDGGRFDRPEAALRQARRLAARGPICWIWGPRAPAPGPWMWGRRRNWPG